MVSVPINSETTARGSRRRDALSENERGLLGPDTNSTAKTEVAAGKYCADNAFALLMCLNSLSVMVVFYW